MDDLDLPTDPASDGSHAAHVEHMTERVRRMVERDLLPRLLLSNQAGPIPPSIVARIATRSGHDIDTLVSLARSPASDTEFREFLDRAVEEGNTVEAVFADLLAPVARRMGVLWEEDECDFFEVTVVCTRIQSAIRRLSSRYAVSDGVRSTARVIVGAISGAQHTLGALTIAESLARNGFDVQLGEPFVKGVSPIGFDVFALSITRTTEFEEGLEIVNRIRDRAGDRISVIVGGAAFRKDPALVRRIGADGWAEDAAAAVSLVRQIVEPFPQFIHDEGRSDVAANL